MNPRKAREVSKKTAEDLNLNPEMVEDIMAFFWKEVRTSVATLRDKHILIDNFGSFQIKKAMLDKKIDRAQNLLKARTMLKFEKFASYKRVESKIEDLRRIKRQYEEEDRKREEFNLKKHGNQPNKDLEK